MENTFQAMISTLRQAQQAVRDAMAPLEAQHLDRSIASDLLEAVHSFAIQAETTLVMMAERDADETISDAAEELATFFRDTEAWVEALLASSRG